MKLSEAERERIRAEEIYRQEVRAAFPNNERTSRVVSFFNSQFGLWLLTAIFVSGAGTAYTSWRAHSVAEEQRLQRVETLDIEIAYRFSCILEELSALDRAYRKALVKSPEGSWDEIDQGNLAVMTLADKPAGEGTFPPLYPEFARYSLRGLMAEERRLLPPADRDQVTKVLGNLRPFMSGLTPEAVAVHVRRGLLLERWTKSVFPQLNCGPLIFCDTNLHLTPWTLPDPSDLKRLSPRPLDDPAPVKE